MSPAPTGRKGPLSPPKYAGFWLRLIAYIIDYVLVVVGFVLVVVLVGITSGVGHATVAQWADYLAFPGGLLYFSLMESSTWQATLGKRLLRLVVTDLEGNRISFVHALKRNLGKIISAIILLIGFLMAGFTEKKQALHDLIAGCLVVRKS